MNQTILVWLLIVLALIAANTPFMNDRLFAIIPLNGAVGPAQRHAARARKPFWLRMLEIVLFYVLIGWLGMAFESTLGNPFKQKWEFYAITLSLFLVMGFPGFVFRYLLRRD
jgi:hypothetical protein